MIVSSGILWCTAVHIAPGAIHEVAVALQVDDEAAVIAMGERGADGRAHAVALPRAAGIADVLIGLVEVPDAMRPVAETHVAGDERPVEILDHRPQFGGEPRGGNRAGVPGVGRVDARGSARAACRQRPCGTPCGARRPRALPASSPIAPPRSARAWSPPHRRRWRCRRPGSAGSPGNWTS